MPSKSANVKDEKQYEKLKKKGCRSPGLPALPTVPVPRTAAGRNRGQAPAQSKVAPLRRRRELAARFAEAGFDLVVAAEEERIGPVTGSLAGYGIQAVPVQADLATFDGVEELHRAIQATGRVPDALAINAGVGVAGDFARDNE